MGPFFQMPKSPPIDDMAPQSISFIGDQDSVDLSSNAATSMKIQQLFQPSNHNLSGVNNHSKINALNSSHGDSQAHLEASLGKLNISSGSRTYRIPSPTRPVMNSKSFQVSWVFGKNKIMIENNCLIDFDQRQLDLRACLAGRNYPTD